MTNIYEITKEEINGLTGEDYEKLVIEYYNVLGFKSTQTPTTNDYGVDVITSMPSGLAAIQCKRQTSNVSLKAIQEVVAGSRKYKADILKVFTSAGFTASAVELGNMWGVQLVDGETFWTMIQEVQENKILLTGKHTLRNDMENFYSSYQIREAKLDEYKQVVSEAKQSLVATGLELNEKVHYIESQVNILHDANRDIKQLKDSAIKDINIEAEKVSSEATKVYEMIDVINSKETIMVKKPSSFIGKIIFNLLK